MDLPPCNIKVIGVGGGGGNAIKRMLEANVGGVEFVVMNTDTQALVRAPQVPKPDHDTKGVGTPSLTLMH